MLSKNSAVCLKRRRIINYQSCLDSSLSSSIPTASFNTLKKSWFNKKNWRSRVANRICCQLNTIRNWMILQLGNKTTSTKSILFFCLFSWFNYFFFTVQNHLQWTDDICFILHFHISFQSTRSIQDALASCRCVHTATVISELHHWDDIHTTVCFFEYKETMSSRTSWNC